MCSTEKKEIHIVHRSGANEYRRKQQQQQRSKNNSSALMQQQSINPPRHGNHHSTANSSSNHSLAHARPSATNRNTQLLVAVCSMSSLGQLSCAHVLTAAAALRASDSNVGYNRAARSMW